MGNGDTHALSENFPYRPTMSIPAPFLLHLVRPALGTFPPHEGLPTLHKFSATPLTPPLTPHFFRAPWLLVAYRSASTAGASPVHAEGMLSRRLDPGSLTGLNVIPEMESVTSLRIHLTMISCESVNEFGSIVNLDVFTVGSQREIFRSHGAVNEGLDGDYGIGCALSITSGR
jgi:hypothetical protein